LHRLTINPVGSGADIGDILLVPCTDIIGGTGAHSDTLGERDRAAAVLVTASRVESSAVGSGAALLVAAYCATVCVVQVIRGGDGPPIAKGCLETAVDNSLTCRSACRRLVNTGGDGLGGRRG